MTVLCFSAGVVCTGLALDQLDCLARQESARSCQAFRWNETTNECESFGIPNCSLQRFALAACQTRLYEFYFGLVEYDKCHAVVADLDTGVCTYNCSVAEFVDSAGAFRYELLDDNDAWCVPRTECHPPSATDAAQDPSLGGTAQQPSSEQGTLSPALLAAIVSSAIALFAVCLACVFYVRLRRDSNHV